METLSKPIQIDPEFQAFFPPLSSAELAALESLIVEEGCRDPIMLWNGFIADGHNRYEICTRLDIPFRQNYLDLPDRDSVILWMLRNQSGRRNLCEIDRIAVAAKVEEIVARKAKENQIRKPESVLAISPDQTPINTRKESAKTAEVGEKKYTEGKIILEAVASGEAPRELLEKVRSREVSIHKAASEIKEARKPAPADEYSAPETAPAKPVKYAMDDAERLWGIAKISLEKILPNDQSRVRIMQEVVAYGQNRISPRKKLRLDPRTQEGATIASEVISHLDLITRHDDDFVEAMAAVVEYCCHRIGDRRFNAGNLGSRVTSPKFSTAMEHACYHLMGMIRPENPRAREAFGMLRGQCEAHLEKLGPEPSNTINVEGGANG